jgi:hypothetical protein
MAALSILTTKTTALSRSLLDTSRIIINPLLPSCYAFTIHYDWTLLLHQINDHMNQSMVSLERLTSLLDDIDVISSSSPVSPNSPHSPTTISFAIENGDRKNDAKSQQRGQLMNNIGYGYLHGLFGTPSDPAKAVEWFKKSAMMNNEFGCFNYGFMLHDGVHTSLTT